MLEDLPLIDEHSVNSTAPPEAVFDAVRRRFAHVLSGPLGRAFSRVWGCDPPAAFEIVSDERPNLVVVAGAHRFSRYGIIFRITATPAGSRLSAESRAEFPGLYGRAYRAAVVGAHGHVVATRTMLRSIAKSAEQTA